jgi:hypothetical protein
MVFDGIEARDYTPVRQVKCERGRRVVRVVYVD